MSNNGITRRSRGIHAAWHSWYAVVFGGESGLRKVGLGGIHPLTQRYTPNLKVHRNCCLAKLVHELSFLLSCSYCLQAFGLFEKEIV